MDSAKSGQIDEIHAAAYECGRRAAASLPAEARFSDVQRRWLDGFLEGLFEQFRSATQPASPETHHSAAVRRAQIEMATAGRDASTALAGTYHRDNPFAAKLQAVIPLPSASSTLHRIVVDLEGSRIRYRPGDWLGVFPQNDPALVRQVLKRYGTGGQVEVDTPRGRGPVWRALLEELDLTTAAPGLIELMAHEARDRSEQRTLSALITSADGHWPTVLGLLRRFPSARPTIHQLVRNLTPLRPCTLPIASCFAKQPNVAEALVRLSGEETSFRGRGVTPRFVTERMQAGEWLPIFVEADGMSLPEDDDCPIVMIAGGLGIGPYRAFLEARSLRRARGRSWLWSDGVAFAEDFGRWHSEGILTRYDRIAADEAVAGLEAQGEPLWRWLVDHTPVHVCGTRTLTSQIEVALVRIAMRHGGHSETSARAFVDGMRDEGRFVREVVSG